MRLAIEGVFEKAQTSSRDPVVSPALRLWQRPIPLVLAGLILLAVGAIGAQTVFRPGPEQVARFPIPLPSDQAFGFAGRSLVSISPDGSHVVYQANQSLWLRSLDQLQAVELPGTEGAVGPFFSADGQSIGFWCHEGNDPLANMLSIARFEENAAKDVTLPGGL